MEIEDIAPLSLKLAPDDISELDKLGVDPYAALEEGYRLGSFVGLVHGNPEAAFGVNRKVYPAAIWFLGSEIARSYPRHFMRISRRWVEMMNRDSAVANVVPVDSKRNIRWLKALDFEFEDEVYTVNGNEFVRFRRGPLTTHLPH